MATTFRKPAPRGTSFELTPVFANGQVSPDCEFAQAFAAAKGAWPELDLGYVGSKKGVHYFQLRGVSDDYAVQL